jgi:hypothetical protein
VAAKLSGRSNLEKIGTSTKKNSPSIKCGGGEWEVLSYSFGWLTTVLIMYMIQTNTKKIKN